MICEPANLQPSILLRIAHPKVFARMPKTACTFALLLALAASTFSGPHHASQDEKEALTFSINVGLVIVPVTVLDKSGRSVAGLEQENFIIYEDGVPQKIQVFDRQDIPVAVGLIIDNSSSMVPKRTEVTAAALDLAESSNPNDEIFVIHFYQHIVYALKLGEAFTSNIEELKAAVSRIVGLGQTALYDAIVSGLEHIQQSGLQRKVLVVVSDGGDNASRHTLKETLDMIAQSNTLIYCVGIYSEYDRERNPKVLRQIAEISGGEAYFPQSPARLSEVCKRIATSIRSQYTLGYIPSNHKKDGSFRKIRITAKNSNGETLTVRTRSGYLAPKE